MTEITHIVQCDKRGQLVIPKEIRDRLGQKECEFELFSIEDKGLFLKVKKQGK